MNNLALVLLCLFVNNLLCPPPSALELIPNFNVTSICTLTAVQEELSAAKEGSVSDDDELTLWGEIEEFTSTSLSEGDEQPININFTNNTQSLIENNVAMEAYFSSLWLNYSITEAIFFNYVSEVHCYFSLYLASRDRTFISENIEQRLNILKCAMDFFYQCATAFLSTIQTEMGQAVICYDSTNKICLQRPPTREECHILNTFSRHFCELKARIDAWNTEYLTTQLGARCEDPRTPSCIQKIIETLNVEATLDTKMQPLLQNPLVKFVIFSKQIFRKIKNLTHSHKKSATRKYYNAIHQHNTSPCLLPWEQDEEEGLQTTWMFGDEYFLMGFPDLSLHETLLKKNLSNYEKIVIKIFLHSLAKIKTCNDKENLFTPDVIRTCIIPWIAPIHTQFSSQYTLAEHIFPYVNWAQLCSLWLNATAKAD